MHKPTMPEEMKDSHMAQMSKALRHAVEQMIWKK